MGLDAYPSVALANLLGSRQAHCDEICFQCFMFVDHRGIYIYVVMILYAPKQAGTITDVSNIDWWRLDCRATYTIPALRTRSATTARTGMAEVHQRPFDII